MFGFFRRSHASERVSRVPNFEASVEERERMNAAEQELRAIARDVARITLDRSLKRPAAKPKT